MADKWDQYAQQPGAQPSADKWDKYAQPAASASTPAPPAEPSNLQKMWNVAKENLNPASMAEGLANISPPGMVYNGFKQMLHPDQPAPGPVGHMAQGSVYMIKAIPQDLREGSYAHALGHGLAAALPGVGPSAVQAGEEMSHGAPAEGFTRAATILAPFALHGGAKAIDAIPSAARAGRGFEEVMGKAGDVPVDTSGVRPYVDRARELSSRGAPAPPKPIRDYVRTTATPGPGEEGPIKPLTYRESRDFASNAGNQSVADKWRTNRPMGAQLKGFAHGLDEANEGAADQAGVGDQYRNAMSEYRKAMLIKQAGKNAAKLAVPAIVGGTAYHYLHGMTDK